MGLSREESRRRKEGGSKKAWRGDAIMKKRSGQAGGAYSRELSRIYSRMLSRFPCQQSNKSTPVPFDGLSIRFITLACPAQDERRNRKGK